MSPTLCDTDVIVVRRIWPNEDLRGEIVVADNGRGLSVKRVLATGGDRLGIRRGMAIRNDRPIAEPYVCDVPGNLSVNWPDAEHRGVPKLVEIQDGSAFLLGDNRQESGDSRIFGVIPESTLKGILLARLPTALQQSHCACKSYNGLTVLQ